MTTALLLADVSGNSLVRGLFVFLVIIICCAAIYYVGRIFIAKLANPKVLMVWDGFFLLIGLVVALNFFLSLIHRQFIDW